MNNFLIETFFIRHLSENRVNLNHVDTKLL